mgnify:CR=1 FL=1
MSKTTEKAPRGAHAQQAALRGITPDQRRNVVEELDQRWSEAAFDFLQRAKEATEAGKSFDARNWVWAGGVATDKTFLCRALPTQIVANLHEHRVDLSGILDKFRVATQVLSVHQRKGYASALVSDVHKPLVPVIHKPLATSNTDAIAQTDARALSRN